MGTKWTQTNTNLPVKWDTVGPVTDSEDHQRVVPLRQSSEYSEIAEFLKSRRS